MKTILLAGMIGLWATGAMGHSPLKGTTPVNEAIVADVPEDVQIEFKGKIRLTRVTMTHSDRPGVKLDLRGHKGFISEYTVPLQPMGSGPYVIEWRGLGADGHALNGSFSFTVE